MGCLANPVQAQVQITAVRSSSPDYTSLKISVAHELR